MSNGAFIGEISNCRTFCLKADVKKMLSRGMALGGNLDNAVVVDQFTVVNPGGLRRDDEFVRHKMLDAGYRYIQDSMFDIEVCSGES